MAVPETSNLPCAGQSKPSKSPVMGNASASASQMGHVVVVIVRPPRYRGGSQTAPACHRDPLPLWGTKR